LFLTISLSFFSIFKGVALDSLPAVTAEEVASRLALFVERVFIAEELSVGETRLQ
jgi:hypothetical protein